MIGLPRRFFRHQLDREAIEHVRDDVRDVLAKGGVERRPAAVAVSPRRLMPMSPGVVLGMGFRGFVDGIVLHQILQWHQC